MYEFNTLYDEETKILDVYCAKQENIDTMEYPLGVDEVHYHGDYFRHVDVPEGVRIVTCTGIGLTSIHLPDSIEYAYLNQNKLEKLEIPRGVIMVIADNNLITSVTFRGGDPWRLEELDLSFNRITRLAFNPPDTMMALRLWRNDHLCELSKSLQVVINKEESTVWGDLSYC